MNRVKRATDGEAIGVALRCFPEHVVRFMGVPHFFTRTDPLFAGVHTYKTAFDGRSYRTTGCFLEPDCQLHVPRSRRTPTIVLPTDYDLTVSVIVHELAHHLHWKLGWMDHNLPEISDYAASNAYERWAEALWAYLLVPKRAPNGSWERLGRSGETFAALFAAISA